jgi:hypothetical protein
MSSSSPVGAANPSETTVEYSVDPDGRIDCVETEAWNRFALANGAPELVDSRRIVGEMLDSFIDGELPRLLYWRMFNVLRAKQVPEAIYKFRCDAPAIERDLELVVYPRFDGDAFHGLRFQSVEIETRVRPGVALLQRRLPGGSPGATLLRMCSYCKRVFDDATSAWCGAEVYLAVGRTADVQLSHGACPECFAAVMRTLDG